MEIGFIYSRKDPRQTKARNFIAKFIKERGLAAVLKEKEEEVASPTLIVDGRALKDQRKTPREPNAPMFPSIAEITKELEKSVWSL